MLQVIHSNCNTTLDEQLRTVMPMAILPACQVPHPLLLFMHGPPLPFTQFELGFLDGLPLERPPLEPGLGVATLQLGDDGNGTCRAACSHQRLSAGVNCETAPCLMTWRSS